MQFQTLSYSFSLTLNSLSWFRSHTIFLAAILTWGNRQALCLTVFDANTNVPCVGFPLLQPQPQTEDHENSLEERIKRRQSCHDITENRVAGW